LTLDAALLDVVGNTFVVVAVPRKGDERVEEKEREKRREERRGPPNKTHNQEFLDLSLCKISSLALSLCNI
jgi:hypothetical protein